MGPINKSKYERHKCRSNVPPILSLRKKDLFDLLFKENQISNPFLSSSEAESSTRFTELKGSQNCSQDAGLVAPMENSTNVFQDSAENVFFPKIHSEIPASFLGKRVNRFKNIKKRRKRNIHKIRESNSNLSLSITSSSLETDSSTSLLASTPKNEKKLINLQRETPCSPITKDGSCLLLPSSSNQLSRLFTKLTFKDVSLESSINPGPCNFNKSSTCVGEFFGFPFSSFKSKLNAYERQAYGKSNEDSKKSTENNQKSLNITDKGTLTVDKKDKEDSALHPQINSSHIENSNNVCDSECEKIMNTTNMNRDDGIDKAECDQIVTCIQKIEDVKLVVVKESNFYDRSSESPCYDEKQNIIIVCGESVTAEDEEDKSEDVSSALSSDQEAREGVSSSDLESNSIEEEKDGYMEMRRQSFEKISPRKSYIIGPFSRRKFILPEGNEESQAQSKSSEVFYTNPSKYQHRFSDDYLTEQNQKTSPLLGDSACDLMANDEKYGIASRSPPSSPALSYSLYENCTPLDPLPENLDENQDEIVHVYENGSKTRRSESARHRRRSSRFSKDRSPSRQPTISRPSVIPDLNMVVEESDNEEDISVLNVITELDHFVLPANKKYRRSLSIIRQLSKEEQPINRNSSGTDALKGRGYDQFVDHIISLQTKGDPLKVIPTPSYRKSLSIRRLSLLGHRTPPRGRRASRISTQSVSTTTESRPIHLRRSVHLSSPLQCSKTQAAANSIIVSSQLHDQSSLKILEYSKLQELLKSNSIIENQDEKKKAITFEGEIYTHKDHIMTLCEQENPVGFLEILDESSFQDSMKVGEGVYGEVFTISRANRKNVLKIIPIEGNFLVNGEKQKTFSEVFTELLISKWLDKLRDGTDEFMSICFVELIASWIVRGNYPDKFLQLWDEYDERKGSDNDRPNIFNEEQLYLVLELGNAGTDLENYSFSTAKQALSIFKQTVFAIAVAEASFEFEHRDLHWGNVLISRTAERFITFKLDGEEYKIITNGVKSTIIDYTLSRITSRENIPIYNDIGQDPDMFIASGDYQFDIYRHMKKDVCDRWEQFIPKTNVRWLHYLIDKMIKKVKYQRKTAKVHRDSMRCLQDIESWILDCDNSVMVALRIDDYK